MTEYHGEDSKQDYEDESDRLKQRVTDLETEISRLRAALRKILNHCDVPSNGFSTSEIAKTAVAALGDEQPTPNPTDGPA